MGFESTVDSRLNFGLGKTEKIDSVVVVWNDGKENILKDVKPNQQITIKQSDAVTAFHNHQLNHGPSPIAIFFRKQRQLRHRLYT